MTDGSEQEECSVRTVHALLSLHSILFYAIFLPVDILPIYSPIVTLKKDYSAIQTVGCILW